MVRTAVFAIAVVSIAAETPCREADASDNAKETKGSVMDAVTNDIRRIEAGVEWRPVEMGDHECVPNQPIRIPELEIIPGTALDLSAIHPRHNIDANGRVIADAEGRLVFENAPESPVRLRGFNCTYGGSWDMFQKASKDEIAALAEQIRLMGFNLIRLHFFDAKFVGLSGRNWWQYRDTLADDAMPQTKEEIDAIVDRDFMDRFHWFVKCLRDRGVYIMFDVATSPNKIMARAKKSRVPTRIGLFLDERWRKLWKASLLPTLCGVSEPCRPERKKLLRFHLPCEILSPLLP